MFLSRDQKLELARIGHQKKISAAKVLRRIIDHALGMEHKPVELDLTALDLKK